MKGTMIRDITIISANNMACRLRQDSGALRALESHYILPDFSYGPIT